MTYRAMSELDKMMLDWANDIETLDRLIHDRRWSPQARLAFIMLSKIINENLTAVAGPAPGVKYENPIP